MCQTLEEGGYRCDSSLVGESNYPIEVTVNSGVWKFDKEKLASNPQAIMSLAIIGARSNQEIPTELLELARQNSGTWETFTPTQKWAFFSKISNLKNPSVALENLHKMGWEKNFPALSDIRDVPQDPTWHPEGAVHVHIQQAADVASRNAKRDNLPEKERQIAILGAICHDFGKSTHTQIDENGKITSRGHDRSGIRIAKKFLESINAPHDMREVIPTLVGQHMCHTNDNPRYKAIKGLESRLAEGGATLEQLVRVIEADTGGRGSAGLSGVGENWLRIRDEHLERNKNSHMKSAALDGNFLKSIGIPPGVHYRNIIESHRNSGEEFEPENAKRWVDNYLSENPIN